MAAFMLTEMALRSQSEEEGERYRTKAAAGEEKAGDAPTAAELQKAAAEEEKAGSAPTAEEEKEMKRLCQRKPKEHTSSPEASPKKMAASQKASPTQKAAGKASPKASPKRGGDRQRRATRGSVGTFAGRLPPKGAEKKAIFNAIRQEYYDSKEWAKEQNFVWKESIDGVFSVQLCWKMMKEIMNGVPADFEQKREMAKNAWRHIVWENFGEVADT